MHPDWGQLLSKDTYEPHITVGVVLAETDVQPVQAVLEKWWCELAAELKTVQCSVAVGAVGEHGTVTRRFDEGLADCWEVGSVLGDLHFAGGGCGSYPHARAIRLAA